MKISLTDKARSYLEKKNAQTVTIDLIVAGGCIEIGEPSVSIGEPLEGINKFDSFEIDGYTLYIFKGADIRKSGLLIDAKKFIGMESLKVTGIRLM
jgi:hypothetical protein